MSWTAPNLYFQHCFFGREKGEEEGAFAGLNISLKGCDSQEVWEQNLEKAAKYFNLKKQNLALLNQGVSAKVFYVDKPTILELDGDGMVTDKANIILGLRTADCAPVLLADGKNKIIGAAHAGWRGALGGIIENTVQMMLEKGADLANIAAAVGPCIAQKSYEVDEVFYQTFEQKNEADKSYFGQGKEKHYYFDLERFCVGKLNRCGIKNVAAAHEDTYSKEEEYYSFRRFTHQGIVKKNGGFAAQLSAIVMKD